MSALTTIPPEWLRLREGADAVARSTELVDLLRTVIAGDLLIRDLGCGTGSMGRWLTGQLPRPQRWILHDRDPQLLALAVSSALLNSENSAGGTGRSGTGAGDGAGGTGRASTDAAHAADDPAVGASGVAGNTPVGHGAGELAVGAGGVVGNTAVGELRDITSLRASELVGTSLVTASALLDLLTADEVDALAKACVKAGCPALFALSVSGHVEFATPDPLDSEFEAAFNAHQRRVVDGRRLLGPDAVDAAVRSFVDFDVHLRPSPWRLGQENEALAAEWLRGWVSAACEFEPKLPGQSYLERRLTDPRVEVQHTDLLAIPKAVR